MYISGRLKTYELVICAEFAAMIAICSWICIPAEIPFTLQTFAVFLSVGILGGRRGTFSVLIYLLLGTVGLPVFSGFSGGVSCLLGATGGYIIGFFFSSLIMWCLEPMIGRSVPALCLAMIAGLIVCYLFGTMWFMTVYMRQSDQISFALAIGNCVIPYIIPDGIKILLACTITCRLRPILNQC